MNDLPPPPTPPSASPAPQRPSARPWKIATAATAILAVAGIVTTYLVMDSRLSEVEDDLVSTQEQLEEAESSNPMDGLLDDLLGGDGLDSGALDDLLGEGGLDDLLGGESSSDMGALDPALFECMAGGGFGEGLPEGTIEEQVASIQQLITEDRGFDGVDDVDIEFVSREEVQQRAVDINEEEIDQEAAADDAAVLASLGAMEPATDLVQMQLDALEGGVGGFYNTETEELVIGSEELDGMGTYITAHELLHALTDAEYGLPDTASLADEQGSDAAYAALSAIEGDASLYGQLFAAQHLSMPDLLGMQTESDATGEAMADLPHVIERDLTFPYVEGMTFTCHVYLDGGWDAVDATYDNVPTTTAQILFPERYTAGEEAVDVRDVSGPSGWDQADHDTFGAADLLFLLEAPGDDPDAALSEPMERARAWAGGEVTTWRNGDDVATSLVLAEHDDAEVTLCETIDEFYGAAFPDAERSGGEGEIAYAGADQSAFVSCDSGEVALGIGPDSDIAQAAIN